MNIEKIKYEKIVAYFKEALRIYIKATSYEAHSEGKARIRPESTYQNKVLFLHHCMEAAKSEKGRKGQSIAEYHKAISGQSARMGGDVKQRSAAIGILATLPRDFFPNKKLLDEEEYFYLLNSDHMPCNPELEDRIKHKLTNINWNVDERKEIIFFFQKLFDVITDVCKFRIEDVLYGVIHFDESYPHLHFIALPSVAIMYTKNEYDMRTNQLIHKKGETRHTFSTARFTPEFFENFHGLVISEMVKRGEPRAKGLLNGSTKKRQFDVAKMDKSDREESLLQFEKMRILEAEIKKLCTEKENIKSVLNSCELQCAVLEERFAEHNSELHNLIKEIIKYKDRILNNISILIKKAIKQFLPQWEKAKSNSEKKKIDEAARNNLSHQIQDMFDGPLNALADFERNINVELYNIEIPDATKQMIKSKIQDLTKEFCPEYEDQFMKKATLQKIYLQYADIGKDTEEIKRLGLDGIDATNFRKPSVKIKRIFQEMLNEFRKTVPEENIRMDTQIRKTLNEIFREMIEDEKNTIDNEIGEEDYDYD